MSTPPYSPTNCPIAKDTKQVQQLSAEMVHILHKIKRDLKACEDCSAPEDCAIRRNFNSQVQAAILAVNEEFNLIPPAAAFERSEPS